MTMKIHSNPQLELAFDYVCHTDKNIFLTGKAGTGKTTFLHRVREQVPKRLVVVAPTGVAAINAKGVTIHSLFQLPFGPILPGQKGAENQKRRFTRKKINLLRSLDLLIIDEISMVRADVLDAIDAVLRRFRRDQRPFGGVQLLMIGDLHQLPPVVKQQDWHLLKDHYQTPYFFGSLALQKSSPISIELKHIYRQSDGEFIALLNKVRNNHIDEAILQKLNSRYIPNFEPDEKEGYITLTSHNITAQEINDAQLAKLPGETHLFRARIDGDFPEYAYPTELELAFKIGAQVMFVKNDISPEKRYYNGKIGQIVDFREDQIYVSCPDDEETIIVKPDEWQNRKFELNPETKVVEEKIIGTFIQHPLKLAWAITIHKSQGLTFEKAIIDAQAAFAHGQVYVALSRCKSFEGIVLRSQIISSSVKTDKVVRNYTEEAQKNEPTAAELLEAKRAYQQECIYELFDFRKLVNAFARLRRVILEHERSLQEGILEEYEVLKAKAEQKVVTLARKFIPQLDNYFTETTLPEDNDDLQNRLKKAGDYFSRVIKAELLSDAFDFQILTDNQTVEQQAKERLEDLQREISSKLVSFESCQQGFHAQRYVKAKADADLEFQRSKKAKPKPPAIPKNIEHKEFFNQLDRWRAETADANQLPRYTVFSTRTLIEIAQVLPTNTKALKRIKGIGKAKLQQYGEVILDMVNTYCQEKELLTDQLQFATGKVPQPPKPDTKKVTRELYESGKSIAEIAEERGLAPSTIEGHLAHFIGTGELDVLQFLNKDKLHKILTYFNNNESESLKEAKIHFGEDFSYGELKMGLKYWQLEKEETEQAS